jgi:hypothetical protein
MVCSEAFLYASSLLVSSFTWSMDTSCDNLKTHLQGTNSQLFLERERLV